MNTLILMFVIILAKLNEVDEPVSVAKEILKKHTGELLDERLAEVLVQEVEEWAKDPSQAKSRPSLPLWS